MPRTYIPALGNEDMNTYWFPIRVTYGRVLMIKKEFESNPQTYDFDYFIPTEEEVITKGGTHKVKTTPTLSNIIFLNTTKKRIEELKHEVPVCSCLRFMTYQPVETKKANASQLEHRQYNRIIIVPDNEMNTFIAVVSKMQEHVTIVPYDRLFDFIGKTIKFIDGPLVGLTGKIRRGKDKNKHVNIDLGGLMTAQIDYIPKAMYQILE